MSYINKEEFRQALIDRQITTQFFNPRERHEIGCIIEMLDKWPTEEVASIVCCKDCEWWTKQEDSAQGRCTLLGIYPTGAWYCGNGRRASDD